MLGSLRSSLFSPGLKPPGLKPGTFLAANLAVIHSRLSSSRAIKPARFAHWLDTEVDLLRKSHVEGKSVIEYCDLFPTRSFAGIESKMNRLGLKPRDSSSMAAKPARFPRRDEWSDPDTDLLRRSHAEGKTPTECLELFPSRSLSGINNKMNRIGLRYRRPNKQPEDSRRVCALALEGLSVDQIKVQLPHLKHVAIYDIAYRNHIPLTPMPRGGPSAARWSAEEDEILLDGDSRKQTAEIIAQRLSGRSVYSVETRIRVLRTSGPTRFATRRGMWKQEELDLLTELNNKKALYKDIALRLGRSYKSVTRRISRLRHESKDSSAGLLRTSFSSRSERFGPVTAGKTTVSLSYSSFAAKSAKSARSRRRDEWTDAEINMLRQAFEDGKSVAECCALFPSRSYSALGAKRNRLGLLSRGSYKVSEDSRRVYALASNSLSVHEIKAELPHLSLPRIYAFAHHRGITTSTISQNSKAQRTIWSVEDEEVLLDAISKQQTAHHLAERFAPKSVTAIDAKMTLLRLYGPGACGRKAQWQDREDTLLIELHEKGNEYKEIASRLSRSFGSVQYRVRALRVKGRMT